MMSRIELAPGHEISRVIRGGWQLAGGHGPVNPSAQLGDMDAFAQAGITTFDCADIYTGVEDMLGAFREHTLRVRGAEALARIKVHTKLVPDLARLTTLTRADVRATVTRSLSRLRTERLGLVQFHWWDYAAPLWLDALGWLADLREEGLVANIGGTNFDTPRLAAILDAGIPMVSMQVQHSVLDTRPEATLAPLAQARGVQLLAFGTVAGGFLSDRWLGQPEPAGEIANRSLVKYRLIIEDFGGWGLFQSLLEALRRVADRHETDIATVASAWSLTRPGVAAVIVGARNRDHLAQNLRIASLSLTPADLAAIEAVRDQRQGPQGDVYTLERDREGPHGRIMHYNLNAGTARASTVHKEADT